MPTIVKPQRKPSDRVKERQKLYQRTDYRKMVGWIKRTRIFCEACLKEGIYTMGKDAHHIISPFQGNLSEEQKLKLLKDEDNILLLCDFHHRLQHGTVSEEEKKKHQEKVRLAKNLTLQTSHTKNGGDKNDTPQ